MLDLPAHLGDGKGMRWLCIVFAWFFPAALVVAAVPEDSRQLILGLTDDWSDSHATLTYYERGARGGWRAVGQPWPARVGREGLAWGRGLHAVPPDSNVAMKREGDMKAPAGIFDLGGVWGYDESVRRHPKMPYRQVTPRDLWIEDPASPHYNRHLVLPHEPRADWEKKGQMRQNDPVHSLKLFIKHNAPPEVQPGAGSAIFFHIWRANGGRPAAGCTTMEEARLRELIARLDPTRRPVFALLPRADYERLREAWKLP